MSAAKYNHDAYLQPNFVCVYVGGIFIFHCSLMIWFQLIVCFNFNVNVNVYFNIFLRRKYT